MENLRNQRIGEVKTNIRGEKMTIIEYTNTHNIIVEFENGIQVRTRYYEFKKGRVFCHRKKTTNCVIVDDEEPFGTGFGVSVALVVGSICIMGLLALGLYVLLGGQM
jgi:hypothetical protein